MTSARAAGAIGALLLLATSACDFVPPARGATEIRIDTIAGVPRVSNPPADPIKARLLTSIGAPGGGGTPTPFEFGRVTSAVLDAEGNVFVADVQAREVRVFAPDGSFVRSFGRAGDGPGEFAGLNSLAWAGDRLLALDFARISTFTRGEEFVERWPWLPITGPSDHVRFYPTGSEEVYVLGLRSGGESERVYIRHTEAGAGDTLVVSAATEPAPRIVVCPRPDGAITFFDVPFAPRSIVSPAPGGEVVVVWTADYRLVMTSSVGDTLRVIERDEPPLAVTDEEWSDATAEFAAFRDDFPDVRCQPPTMERPRTKAAIQGVFFSHEGDLVVEVTSDGGSRFDVFDASGVAKGSVLTPPRDPRVAPYFRSGRMVQVSRDDLDVQHVQLFDLRGFE